MPQLRTTAHTCCFPPKRSHRSMACAHPTAVSQTAVHQGHGLKASRPLPDFIPSSQSSPTQVGTPRNTKLWSPTPRSARLTCTDMPDPQNQRCWRLVAVRPNPRSEISQCPWLLCEDTDPMMRGQDDNFSLVHSVITLRSLYACPAMYAGDA